MGNNGTWEWIFVFVVVILFGGSLLIMLDKVTANDTTEEQIPNPIETLGDLHMKDSVFYKETNTGICFMMSGTGPTTTVTLVPCNINATFKEFAVGD